MLHAKFQDYENLVLEKNIFQGLFYIIWAWQPFDHVIIKNFAVPKEPL